MNLTKGKKPRRGLGRRLQESEFFMNLVGKVVERHIRMVFATSKVAREPSDTDSYLEKHHPFIGAMWHGQFLLLPLIKPKRIAVSNMVAKHADGEMIGRALVRFVMGLIRGAGAASPGRIAEGPRR